MAVKQCFLHAHYSHITMHLYLFHQAVFLHCNVEIAEFNCYSGMRWHQFLETQCKSAHVELAKVGKPDIVTISYEELTSYLVHFCSTSWTFPAHGPIIHRN